MRVKSTPYSGELEAHAELVPEGVEISFARQSDDVVICVLVLNRDDLTNQVAAIDDEYDRLVVGLKIDDSVTLAPIKPLPTSAEDVAG